VSCAKLSVLTIRKIKSKNLLASPKFRRFPPQLTTDSLLISESESDISRNVRAFAVELAPDPLDMSKPATQEDTDEAAVVDALREGHKDEFLCTAGTLAHYVGDRYQSLHISYLHHNLFSNYESTSL
jgi:hypothetical protein